MDALPINIRTNARGDASYTIVGAGVLFLVAVCLFVFFFNGLSDPSEGIQDTSRLFQACQILVELTTAKHTADSKHAVNKKTLAPW